ncbi:MAG: NAD-binding protein [Proteobacteria bacterium]|nr:NAD-binding protein [Pseudomonadota bacterium]NIS68794.1 NAD-binding protein [Pseudomonadota bacterium]
MNVAIIGTGLMGRPMGERIMNANHRLIAYNRTPEKAKPLAFLGADVVSIPAEAIASSECVVLMLADAQAIRETLLQKDALGSVAESTVIQMGTISPEESITIQGEILRAGGDYFEAPVLGSIPQAEKGELIVMVGSTSEQFGRWSDLLRCFGPDPVLIGPVGHAAALKLALNQLIASLTAAFALSLNFLERKEIDLDLFMKILRKSALYAPMFDKKLERMIERDYANPNFPAKHLAKDIDLFLNEAKPLRLQTVGLEGVRQLVQMTLTRGWAETDYSALFQVISQGVG